MRENKAQKRSTQKEAFTQYSIPMRLIMTWVRGRKEYLSALPRKECSINRIDLGLRDRKCTFLFSQKEW